MPLTTPERSIVFQKGDLIAVANGEHPILAYVVEWADLPQQKHIQHFRDRGMIPVAGAGNAFEFKGLVPTDKARLVRRLRA
jgi:hypothetical protein